MLPDQANIQSFLSEGGIPISPPLHWCSSGEGESVQQYLSINICKRKRKAMTASKCDRPQCKNRRWSGNNGPALRPGHRPVFTSVTALSHAALGLFSLLLSLWKSSAGTLALGVAPGRLTGDQQWGAHREPFTDREQLHVGMVPCNGTGQHSRLSL